MTTRLHASAVLVGERGVLIRGASGAGKSSLAMKLILSPPRIGFAESPCPVHLVGDDQILLESHAGRLLARPHPQIEGLLEVRGYGLIRLPYIAPVVIGLIVDFGNAERLPVINHQQVLIEGVVVPRIWVTPGERNPAERVAMALSVRPEAD